MMKKGLFLIFALFTLGFSCTDSEDPLRGADLTWLNERIAEMDSYSEELKPYFYIAKGKYQDETVFIFANCCPLCNSVLPVYNVDGDFIANLSTTEGGIPYEVLEEGELYYTPENFSCSSNK